MHDSKEEANHSTLTPENGEKGNHEIDHREPSRLIHKNVVVRANKEKKTSQKRGDGYGDPDPLAGKGSDRGAEVALLLWLERTRRVLEKKGEWKAPNCFGGGARWGVGARRLLIR